MRPDVKLRRVFASGLAMALASGPAAAHPDITMECRVLFNFEAGKLTGLGEAWTFDAAFSEQLIADYDEDHDGTFDDVESGAMEREVFGNLAGIHYYTFLTINDREQADLKPFGFRARQEGGLVTFAFGIRLPEPLDPALYPVRVELKDPEFAVYAVLSGDQPALLRGDAGGHCRAAIRDDRENPYFDGTVIPQEIRLVCS